MKLQFAYRVSGEDRNRVKETLRSIADAFESQGHEVYVPILNVENESKSEKEVFHNTVSKISDSDAMVAVVQSGQKSEGMLIEAGYAIAQDKKLVLLLKKGINTRLLFFAGVVVEFEDMRDLLAKVKELEL